MIAAIHAVSRIQQRRKVFGLRLAWISPHQADTVPWVPVASEVHTHLLQAHIREINLEQENHHPLVHQVGTRAVILTTNQRNNQY